MLVGVCLYSVEVLVQGSVWRFSDDMCWRKASLELIDGAKMQEISLWPKRAGQKSS